MQKSAKNSNFFKNYGHFWIPYPQISLKQYSNICENVLYFFYYVGGWKSVGGFSQSNSILKNLKLVSLGSFWHFATTTHCDFAFWKIDPPYCACIMFSYDKK